MARVNLIPPERRRGSARKRLAGPSGLPGAEVVLGALVLLLLLAAIVLFVGERRDLSEARAAVVEARADSARLHGAVERVERIQNAQTRLAQRIEILEGVVDGRLYWLRLMETLSRTLPSYVWLEQVDRQDLGTQEIRIEGASFANAAITDYMRGLEAAPELRDVRLVEVARSRRDSIDIQRFTLVAGAEGWRTPTVGPDSTARQDGSPREIEPAPSPPDGGTR